MERHRWFKDVIVTTEYVVVGSFRSPQWARAELAVLQHLRVSHAHLGADLSTHVQLGPSGYVLAKVDQCAACGRFRDRNGCQMFVATDRGPHRGHQASRIEREDFDIYPALLLELRHEPRVITETSVDDLSVVEVVRQNTGGPSTPCAIRGQQLSVTIIKTHFELRNDRKAVSIQRTLAGPSESAPIPAVSQRDA